MEECEYLWIIVDTKRFCVSPPGLFILDIRYSPYFSYTSESNLIGSLQERHKYFKTTSYRMKWRTVESNLETMKRLDNTKWHAKGSCRQSTITKTQHKLVNAVFLTYFSSVEKGWTPQKWLHPPLYETHIYSLITLPLLILWYVPLSV